MLKNLRTLRIEWGDCDPAGIVYYPRYFAMFDHSTTTLISAASGLNKFDLLKKYAMAGYPMVDTRARFLVPIRYGDDVTIESQFTKVGTSSFDIRHKLFRGSTLCVEGFETRVWVGYDPHDPARIRSNPIPEDLAAKFRAG
ncbi:MAG: acyl-CoA thioesterase [Pseudorhodoplanes sp.]|nr:MAG: acyl-CoA thioesterase [Pseudorhodoplanes sp.]